MQESQDKEVRPSSTREFKKSYQDTQQKRHRCRSSMDHFCQERMGAVGDFELQGKPWEKFSDDADDTIENEDRRSYFCQAIREIEYREDLQCTDTDERVNQSYSQYVESASEEYEFPVFPQTEEKGKRQEKYGKRARVDAIDDGRNDDNRQKPSVDIGAQKIR